MKLLERLDQKLRLKGSPISTRRTYGHWVEKYFRFLLRTFGRDVHPERCGQSEIEQWLASMAVRGDCSPSTQNLALQSVLFLYREILGMEITGVDAMRSRRPTRVPTVLSLNECAKLLPHLRGVALLVAKIQIGCGLRIGEVVSLRMKDLDFDCGQITVRSGKGAKDRLTCMPTELHDSVRAQVRSMRILFDSDRRDDKPGVSMPDGFGKKSPKAWKEWPWFYLFASGNLSRHPDTKVLARHHMDGDSLNRQFKQAASRGGVVKRVTSHTFRHTFATHMLSTGTDIRTLASMLGHNDIRTTMIYTHCVTNSATVQSTPFADLLRIGKRPGPIQPGQNARLVAGRQLRLHG